MKPTLTIKEIAAGVGVSERTAKRKQGKWGLKECRSKASKCPILFFRDKVNAALLASGVIDSPIK